jgi:hypothetical protein
MQQAETAESRRKALIEAGAEQSAGTIYPGLARHEQGLGAARLSPAIGLLRPGIIHLVRHHHIDRWPGGCGCETSGHVPAR